MTNTETKKRGRKPKEQKPRFLVVENMTASAISFRNPDSQHKGLADLNIAPFDTEVIEEYWLDVAWFVRQLNEGALTTYRADAPPPKRDLTVSSKLQLTDRLMEAQALAIVSNPLYSEISKALINIEPRDVYNVVDRDWLKTSGNLFLRNIMEREGRWRKRADLLADCKKRIQYISDL